jgi:hypothetical protein
MEEVGQEMSPSGSLKMTSTVLNVESFATSHIMYLWGYPTLYAEGDNYFIQSDEVIKKT